MEQKTEVKQLITKDMTIGDVVAKYPSCIEVLQSAGVHCVGCGASTFETLEQGVLGHGFSEKELNKLVSDLNKAINSKQEKKAIKEIKNFSLKLSDKAIKKINEIIKSEGKEKNTLRISVLAGGCSGYTYDLELIENAPKEDLKFKQNNLEISVDRESMEYLSGTTIDFIDSLKESGFKFLNPNATKECGCGKSFS